MATAVAVAMIGGVYRLLNRPAILLFGGLLLAGLAALGWLLLGPLSNGGPATAVALSLPPVTPAAVTPPPLAPADLGPFLLAAGLNPQPLLGDTAVEKHLRRLNRGAVDAGLLSAYGRDLRHLTAVSAAAGRPIPAPFWDVYIRPMRLQGVTEYELVQRMAAPGMVPYVRLLARSYERFAAFKADEAAGTGDTAVDAALDILLLVIDHLEAEQGPLPPDAPAAQRAQRAEEALLLWQTIVSGRSREHPLTGQPMVAPTLLNRLTVMEMWRYEQGLRAPNSTVWGVSGFAPPFVGDPLNENQVDHLAISALLQTGLGQSLLLLDLEEDRELWNGHTLNAATARADKALNRVVAEQFAPTFAADMRGTVARLRCALKGGC